MPKTKHKANLFRLDEQERLLWQKVAATVRPLFPEKHQKGAATDDLDAAMMKEIFCAGDTAAAAPPKPAGKNQKRHDNQSLSINPPVATLSLISRKEQRKLARQHFDAQARLDLHGASQEAAYELLLHFIRANSARNQSLVLVITGKGQRMGGSGILRQLVPKWLETVHFRPYVSAVEVAARHHGGEGALYVRLRRNVIANL